MPPFLFDKRRLKNLYLIFFISGLDKHNVGSVEEFNYTSQLENLNTAAACRLSDDSRDFRKQNLILKINRTAIIAYSLHV